MQLYEKFSFVTKLLVDANLKRQSELRPQFPSMSAKSFVNEFCTVSICSGRRSGVDHAMFDIIGQYFEKPIVVNANFHISEIFKRNYDIIAKKENYKSKPEFINIQSYVNSNTGIDCDSILVNNARLIDRIAGNKLEFLIDNFCYKALSENFLVLLLG